MCWPEEHWFLKQKILFFHPLQIWIKKTLFVNSDVPNRIQLVEASYCKYCSLIFYDFIWLVSSLLFVQSILMGCSRIPVNKDTNSIVDKKGSLYQLSTLAVTSINCVCSLEPTFPRIRTREDLGRFPDDESGRKAKERYLYIKCYFICVSGMIIIPYLESKGKIDIHLYWSRTWLQ